MKTILSEPSLLQLLLDAQSLSGRNYVSEDEVSRIARELNVSKSRVYSTASFYSEISLEPRGRHLVRICTNAPCENAGKAEVQAAIQQELGIVPGETTEDGMYTLESVNCLGACYMSPAIRIDDEVYGNLDSEEAVRLIRETTEE